MGDEGIFLEGLRWPALFAMVQILSEYAAMSIQP